MKKPLFKAGLLALLVVAAPRWSLADNHVAVGIVDSNGITGLQAGDKLSFIGSSVTGNTYHMVPRATGKYGGYYSFDEIARSDFPNEYFNFIALSDGQALPAQAGHALTGAYLWMEISSVAGPAGAHVGFWDENQASFRTTPNVSFLTNTATGNYKFELSEPLDPPAAPVGAITESGGLHYIVSGSTTSLSIAGDEDPYGHIHNRGWTVDQPGDYYIGLTIYDLSTNGPGGGPLQAKSDTYIFHLQAIPEAGCVQMLVVATAGAAALRRPRRGG